MEAVCKSPKPDICAAAKEPQALDKRHIFVGGLHRSGTSLTHRLIRAHPAVSGFAGTDVPEDEGQHLQTVYPPASLYGGPGRFAFDPRSHLTQESPLVSVATRQRLLAQWAPYWDNSKGLFVEKSPPNLIRARFLQALFPEAMFLFVIRHPVAVSLATKAWTGQSLEELIRHWIVAHEIFLDDLNGLTRWAWIRYEDLTTRPESTLADLFDYAGLMRIQPSESIAGENNARYLDSREFDSFRGSDMTDSSIFGHFGYRLQRPYFDLAPGSGRLRSNKGRAEG